MVTAATPSDVSSSPRSTRAGIGLVSRYVKWHPGPFTLSVISSTLFAAMTVASAWVLGMLVDQVVIPVFDGRNVVWGDLWLIVGSVLGVTFLRVVGVLGRRYFAGMASERVSVTLRTRLADRYLSAPVHWLEKRQGGTLLAHAEADVEQSVQLMHPVPFSIAAAMIAVFAVISLLSTDLVLAAVAFALFPTLAIVNQIYSNRIATPTIAAQEQLGVVSAIASESFDGALVVKALGREDDEGDRFRDATEVLRADRESIGFIRATFEAVLDLLPNVGMVAVVVIGAYRVDAGAVTTGQVIQVVTLFSLLAFPMRVFGFFLESVPGSLVASHRIEGALRPETEQKNRAARSQARFDGEELALRDVGFAYAGAHPTLSRFNLSLDTGEVVALVGPTGSGKSSVVELITGLRTPTSGQVVVAGYDTATTDAATIAQHLAVAFQEAFLFAGSVEENIAMGRDLSAADVRWAARLAAADDFISELDDGYQTVVGERGITLSGGQRQRVALARAVAGRPQVLVLDDATSAVDPRIEQQILDRLRSETRTTTLIVAQRVATIMLADRVAFMSRGQIVAVGTHAELMATVPDYASLVRAYE